MKLSVALSQKLGADTVRYAHAVERLGFDGVYVFDHLTPPWDANAPAIEAVSALGAIAAQVPRITIGSMVMRATLRPPQVTRDIAMALNAMAPGRIVMGLGAGDVVSAPEMERFGMGSLALEERIELLRTTVAMVESEGVPTVVGGRHHLVAGVAAEASGWNLWEPPMDELASAVESHPKVSWAGRITVEDQPVDTLRALAKSGCTEAIVSVLPAASFDSLTTLAEQLS